MTSERRISGCAKQSNLAVNLGRIGTLFARLPARWGRANLLPSKVLRKSGTR